MPTNPSGESQIIQRYHRLLEMSLDLVSTLDLRQLLEQIVDAACELTASEAASLLLHDAKANVLHFEAATGPIKKDIARLSVPVENSIAGQIFLSQEPLMVDDAFNDSRVFREVDEHSEFQTQSILGVPLMVKENALGVIEVINKLNGEFTSDDIQLLEFLAAQAAMAIENSRLFQQSDLVAEIVHELRTPLNALVAAAHLLQRPELSKEQQTELSNTISSEVKRLNEMASDFLELSRLESGRVQLQREPVDIGGLIRESIEVVKPQGDLQSISIEHKVASDLPMLMGDRSRLKRLLLNLLTNAIKYNKPQGKIIVRAFEKEKGIHLEVEDHGIGIPQKSVPHIFERFYRVPGSEGHVGGTGLGLTIAQRITHSHGGEIWLESEEGVGTTFHMQFPPVSISGKSH